MLSEEEMINVLGGENNETITTQPTNPGTQNPDKCNKCDKCDKRPINQLRGYLNENGDIVWKEKPIIHDYNLFDEGCVCNDCAYYPLCYGGCPVLREDRIKENGGTLPCGYAGDFSIFEHRILDYCWRVINNRKLKL